MEVRYPDIQPFYMKVFSDAIQDLEIQKELDFVRTFFEEWCGNFLHPLGDEFSRQGKTTTMLFDYMVSQSLTFEWIGHSLLFANYATVVRELQSILYKAFSIYRIDSEKSSKVTNSKNIEELFKQSELSKLTMKEAFESSGFSDWQEGYIIYNLLSEEDKFLLVSQIRSLENVESRAIDYNREQFLRCSNVWKRLLDVLVSLMVDNARRAGLKFETSGIKFKI